MKKIITIVSLVEKHPGFTMLTEKGSDISFIREATNKKDPDAILVMCNGEQAGYVANIKSTILEGTIGASEFKNSINSETVANVLSIIDKTTEHKRWKTYLAEVNIQVKKKRKNNTEDQGATENKADIVEFALDGSQSIFPERLNAFEAFSNGKEVKVTLKNTDRGIEAFTVNDSIGSVRKSSDRYKDINDLVDEGSVTGTLSSKSTMRGLKVLVNLSVATSTYDEEIDRLVGNGILTIEQIQERIQYLRRTVKLNENQINNILKQIEQVEEQDRGRLIKSPKTKFVEYNGYFYESIVYKNHGKFMRYVGGKGSGKDTCAETLAWIYNRPTGLVAVNEGLDKVDLTGSRIVDSDENGNLKMPFELSTFVEGLKKGWFVIVDEVNTANPSLLTIFHALDARRKLDIPGYGTVDVHPQASVILTMNEDYCGTMPLNEATVDRFTPIIFEDAQDIRDILKSAVPTAKDKDVEICQQFYEILRALYNDGKISSYPISIRGFIDALDVADDLGLKKGIETNVTDKGVDKVERLSLHEQLKLLFN